MDCLLKWAKGAYVRDVNKSFFRPVDAKSPPPPSSEILARARTLRQRIASGLGWAGFPLGLPAKLLLLTLAFAMVAEVFIFVPSVANFRRNWLMQRLVASKIASLALEASGGAELPERLRKELLMTAGVHAVSLKRADFRRLVLGMPDESVIAAVYDLRTESFFDLMRDGLKAFRVPRGRLIRVIGFPDSMPGDEVDVVIDETPLHTALWAFARNIFWLSLLISIITAACVYFAIIWLLVRPMMRITNNMIAYRENPEDHSRVIVPSARRDEIGIAEEELATLQTQLSGLLRERARLANVGLAVSKINHDLRNLLAGAQLVSDRLSTVADPTVQRFIPRLIRALDRAIVLCADTIRYGKSQESPPNRSRFLLQPLIAEAVGSLGEEALKNISVTVLVEPDLELVADRDHMFRVLFNLIKNAVDAVSEGGAQSNAPLVEVSAAAEGGLAVLRVRDNGPGVSEALKSNLFKAFQTSNKSQGSGLGLAISAELIEANGGSIGLEDGRPGAIFVVRLPLSRGSRGRTARRQPRDAALAQERVNR